MKYILPLVAILALVGAGCKQQTYSFDNQNQVTPDDNANMSEKPQSDQVGVKINVNPPANLLTQRIETGSTSKVGPVAVVTTTLGEIKIQLFEEATPKTVENFINLAEQDFYDGTTFHRIISDFMIQGGDPLTREQRENRSMHGTGGPGYTFADEISQHQNVRGSISMANSGPNTNGSQFFIITTEATPWLDGKHAVFGDVIEGMDVIDAIEAVQTDARDNPVEPIEIIDIQIER